MNGIFPGPNEIKCAFNINSVKINKGHLPNKCYLVQNTETMNICRTLFF